MCEDLDPNGLGNDEQPARRAIESRVTVREERRMTDPGEKEGPSENDGGVGNRPKRRRSGEEMTG